LEVLVMFTIRNLGGVSLLLMGSTWIWLTPAFAGRGVSTSGLLWAVTRALCLLTIAGFCVATWGLFARHQWWEVVAQGSAALGAVTLVVYWVAAARGGEPAGTVSWNVFVHVVMIAGLFVLLLVPSLERWVDHHVMSG
jgi:hypothetical protein